MPVATATRIETRKEKLCRKNQQPSRPLPAGFIVRVSLAGDVRVFSFLTQIFKVRRFTETQKWEDAWFRKLKPVQKLLWQWMCDKCDAAGVIEPDWELAGFQIGDSVSHEMLADFGHRISTLPSGKVRIVKFVQFQYGKLSRACKPHMPVFATLAKHGLDSDQIEQNEQYKNTVDGYVKRRIIERDGLRCVYYGTDLEEGQAVIDHVIPRSKGGTADDSNLVVASALANQRKSDLSVQEFCRRDGLDFELIAERLSKAIGKPIEGYQMNPKGYHGSLKEKEKEKEKVKDEEKDTEKAKEPAAKSRGTLVEFKEFFTSIGLPESDADYTFHKWQGNGWVNGKNPIKDWRATVRQWKSGNFFPSQKNGGQTQLMGRGY